MKYKLSSDNWFGLSILEFEEDLWITYGPPPLYSLLSGVLPGIGSVLLLEMCWVIGKDFVQSMHHAPVYQRVWEHLLHPEWTWVTLKVYGLTLGLIGLYFILLIGGGLLLYTTLASIINVQTMEATPDDLTVKQFPLPIARQSFSAHSFVRAHVKAAPFWARVDLNKIVLETWQGTKLTLKLNIYSLEDAERIANALNNWLAELAEHTFDSTAADPE